MSRDEFTSIMGSVFQQYDTDKSGYLDLGEFMAAMRDSGINFTDKQVMLRRWRSEPADRDVFALQLIMLMAEADQNDDGAIQYAEFADVALQVTGGGAVCDADDLMAVDVVCIQGRAGSEQFVESRTAGKLG